jgi:uncharacterized protein (DUF1778 family)
MSDSLQTLSTRLAPDELRVVSMAATQTGCSPARFVRTAVLVAARAQLASSAATELPAARAALNPTTAASHP